MNPTHIHLLITHLPIFGTFFGIIVLIEGIWSKSNPTKIAAYSVFIISALGAFIAYLTGEGAEEGIEHLPGIVEQTIKTHEHFALYAFIALIILGLVSVFGILITLMKTTITRNVAIIILIFSFICFGLVARTGYLGGQIRHIELSGNSEN